MDNLERAFKNARKGKTGKPYVLEFVQDLENNIERLHGELISGTYQPLPLRTFILRDPKTRKISVSDFRDRIVHHAICNVLEPIFERYFIYDSYANRKGKGSLAALERFDEFKRKVSHGGSCPPHVSDANAVKGFVLKADIRHYFDTVDHQKLLGIIGGKIKDEKVLELIGKIVANHRGKRLGVGMPLGNLTSQFFANVYLDKLDQFVKHDLKAKHYIRYVDDFIILHHSASQLRKWKKSIDIFLQTMLLLELHQQKSAIHPLASGVDFLGFRCFYHFRLLRKRNVRKMEKKLEWSKTLLKEGKMTVGEILEIVQGWNAYAMHADTYTLRRRMMNATLAIIQH